MIHFIFEHILAHPLALAAGLLIGALVPGVKLWLTARAASVKAAL